MSEEQRKADQINSSMSSVTTFGHALNTVQNRIDSSVKLAARTRLYHHETIHRIRATWPEIIDTPLQKISLDDVLEWSKKLHARYSSNMYNNAWTGFTHHDLRHFFAIRLIELGFEIPTAARMPNHADGGALSMKVYGRFQMAFIAEGGISHIRTGKGELSIKIPPHNRPQQRPGGGYTL